MTFSTLKIVNVTNAGKYGPEKAPYLGTFSRSVHQGRQTIEQIINKRFTKQKWTFINNFFQYRKLIRKHF